MTCAALLLASCPPEAKTDAKAASPQLAISYCGVDGITSLTLVEGVTPQKLTSNYAVSWTSGDDTTADVDENGTITLKQATAANTPVFITAAAAGQTASFELTVLAAGTVPSIAVKSEADLRLMGCADGVSRLAATYTLANDITLTKEWSPIGGVGNPFTGTLDGAAHIIRNLFINQPKSNQVGLVSQNAGTIKDIGVELGAAGITGNLTAGALVGLNQQNGTVHGVVSGMGSIHSTAGQPSGVGGLVGDNSGTVIGISLVVVDGSAGTVGGLVGYNNGSVKGYATRDIISANNVGGLVGFGGFGTSVVGYYVGAIDGLDGSIGGLVGDLGNTLTGYARGAVSVRIPGNTSIGKVVGNVDATATVNAYYSGKAGESTFTGGTANSVGKGVTIDPSKTKSEKDYFENFDFTNDWEFIQGKWPAIKFPAGEKIFDPYRGEDQPIEP